MSAATASAPPVIADEGSVRDYLADLYDGAGDGYLSLAEFLPDGTSRVSWFPASDLDGPARLVASAANEGRTIYAGMGLRSCRLPNGQRGGAGSVCGIPGLWADVDYRDVGAHTRGDLPADADVALAIIREATPVPPTLIVDSGYGFYPFLLFREFWRFDDDTERERAGALLRRYQYALRMSANGSHIDTTSDLARVLKLPGSINWKRADGPRLVRVTNDSGPRFTADELEEILPQLESDSRGEGQAYAGALGRLLPDELEEAVAIFTPWHRDGARHFSALHVAGWCGRAGFEEADALAIMDRLSATDRKPADRKKAIRDTYARLRAGNPVSGYYGLRDAVGMDDTALERLEALRERFRERTAPRVVRGADRKAASASPWPVLDEAALYGLAGDVVRTIAPHTEGDLVALLVNFLVMFGSAVGRTPHARVGQTKHHVNEFAVHVGETARARKGTASNEIVGIMERADPYWKPRVQGGLSSGEGLLHAVRDPIEKPNKDGEMKLADPGVDDKRLLAVEPEFSRVLRSAGRDGNTLSELLRCAWDGGDLRSLTRTAPLTATSPHISALGHITRPELLRELSETYQANGFANRFLFVCVRRSKLLPHGGALPDAEVSALAERVRKTLDAARKIGAIRRDDETNTVWEGIYAELTAERPGIFGAITARAEAHVLRLSTLYALLDGSPQIRRVHLHAALAVWQFTEDSARFIFGDATGDPVADQILTALRRNGKLTQTQVSDLFARNQKAGRIEQALALLLTAGLVHTWQGESEHRGRAPTFWEAVS